MDSKFVICNIWRAICVPYALMIIGCQHPAQSSAPVVLPVVPGTYQCDQADIVSVRVNVSNPRNLGAHYFTDDRGASKSSRHSSDTPIEVREYTVDVVRYVRRRGEEKFLLPVFVELHSGLHGDSGEFQSRPGPLFVFVPVNAVVNKINVPINESIDEYMLICKAREEETTWRVFLVSAEQIRAARETATPLIIPDLFKLPKLSDNPAWSGLLGVAENYEKALQANP